MTASLKRAYFFLMAPALVGFLVVFALEQGKGAPIAPPPYPDLLVPLIFILSVIFAAALPIFYRSFFASRMRDRKHASEDEWLRFERMTLCIAMVTPYLALAAHILQLPRFHYTGTALMAIYAIYYYYPSAKRLAFDRKMFRVP